jgi:hypothetical protein
VTVKRSWTGPLSVAVNEAFSVFALASTGDGPVDATTVQA